MGPCVADDRTSREDAHRGHLAGPIPRKQQLLDRPIGKQETGRVVPTWNYVAVHVQSTPRLRDDTAFLREHLESLTQAHEASREHPWHVDDAPSDYIEQMMKAIVAVEFPIDRIEGKWKMSQNRSDADIDGVVNGLGTSPSSNDGEVARIVSERRPKR